MRRDVIIFILIVIGIGWAAMQDYNRVDPNWKKDKCHKGISYSLHQRESDDRWVIGIRNFYLERLAVKFNVKWDGGQVEETGLVRMGETSYFFVNPGENPTAKIKSIYFAESDGTILQEIKECE